MTGPHSLGGQYGVGGTLSFCPQGALSLALTGIEPAPFRLSGRGSTIELQGHICRQPTGLAAHNSATYFIVT